MKVIIKQEIMLEQLKEKIAQQFPNYQLSMRGSSVLVVKKSGTAAALVMVRKGKVIINEGFPSMGGQVLFTLSLLLFGIIIPMIIYFTAFLPGQKAVRNEIAAFVQSTFGQA